MEQLMFALLIWLGAHTSYVIPNGLPFIEYKSAQELSDMKYGSNYSERRLEVSAIFSDSKKTIYLNKKFDLNNKIDQGILLHELVHYLQMYNALDFKCVEAREPEAYQLTHAWSQEQGIGDPFQDPIFKLLLLQLAKCPNF